MLNKTLEESNLINRLAITKSISIRLLEIINESKEFLFIENRKATSDTDYTISHDFEYIITYLRNYNKNNSEIFNKKLKAKGNILLMLSYNEPFILSIIPVLNALIAGNSVTVKPSKRCVDFFKKIWIDTGIIKNFNLKLEIISNSDQGIMENIIPQMHAVYFFGSFENAKIISKICAEYFVEFIPEVETADCKIFNISLEDSLERECISTIKQSFTHAGQSCQRVCGIFIPENSYERYKDVLIAEYHKMAKNSMYGIISPNFKSNSEYKELISTHIRQANPSEIIESKDCLGKIVLNPNPLSDFVKSGYFYPILWVISYKNEIELIRCLNQRRFFLGLNIISDDILFINNIIDSTKFTRYTVNIEHIKIADSEGWGGRWPSGSGGYKNWIEHFSVPYHIISR